MMKFTKETTVKDIEKYLYILKNNLNKKELYKNEKHKQLLYKKVLPARL